MVARRASLAVRAALAGAAATAVTTAPTPAHADDGTRTSSLSWVRMPGAETCVATQPLARAVEERLGRHAFVSASEADVSVEGRIEPRAGGRPGWHAVLILRDAKGATLGTRELARDEKSCDAMTEPLALVVAVMIDPDAATRPPSTAPAPASPSPSPAGADAQAAAPPPVVIERTILVRTPEPPPKPRWYFDGGWSLAGAVGLLPKPAVGSHIDGLLEPPKFVPIEVLGAAWLDQTRDDGTELTVVYVGSGICPLRGRWRYLHLYLCGEGWVGALRFRAKEDAYKAIVMTGARARATIPFARPFALRVGLGGAIPWVYEGVLAPVVGQLDVGLGLVFP